LGRHGDYLLTRNKDKRWVVRDLKGRFVSKEKRSQVFKKIFGKRKPKTILVEYVRTFVFGESGAQIYHGVDVVEIVEEPFDITDEQIEANLFDPARVRRMQTALRGDLKNSKGEFLPPDIKWGNPVEGSSFMGKATGGARRIADGTVGLRWEDLRDVARRGSK